MVDRILEGKFTLLAEIGVNYYDIASKLNISLMDAAKFMILSAANAGVHGVKFQSYKADTLASKFSPSYWDTEEESTTSQYELFKKYDSFGVKEYDEISDFCKRIGVEFCSTPFDFESVDYLENLMDVYKISSSDLSNFPFIEYIAKKNKPIFISAGASNEDEIDEAVNLIRKHNDRPLTLLHCVLEYPTPYGHANLKKINSYKKKFPEISIGYSDHTKPDTCCDVIKTAYLLGAVLVEKHFTVDKKLVGNDHYHAMDESDVKRILNDIEYIDNLCGNGDLKCLDSEIVARKNARRSIVASRDIQKGETITREMLLFKRPGTGISPRYIGNILGKRATIFISADSILSNDMIENDEKNNNGD